MRQYRNKVIHTGTCPVTFGEQEQQEPVSPANKKEQHAPDGVLIRSSCLLLRKNMGKKRPLPLGIISITRPNTVMAIA